MGVEGALVVTNPQAYIRSQTTSVLHPCTSPIQLLSSWLLCSSGCPSTPPTSSQIISCLWHGHHSNHECDECGIRNGWPSLPIESHVGTHHSVNNSAQLILGMSTAFTAKGVASLTQLSTEALRNGLFLDIMHGPWRTGKLSQAQ